MPGKKKKYNARFPPARIKKIMQSDDEVGKVAAPVPVIISRALELFAETLLQRAKKVSSQRGARTLTPSHLKYCIQSETRFDFLKDLVTSVPELQGDMDCEGGLGVMGEMRVPGVGRARGVGRGASRPTVPGTGKRRGRPPKVGGAPTSARTKRSVEKFVDDEYDCNDIIELDSDKWSQSVKKICNGQQPQSTQERLLLPQPETSQRLASYSSPFNIQRSASQDDFSTSRVVPAPTAMSSASSSSCLGLPFQLEISREKRDSDSVPAPYQRTNSLPPPAPVYTGSYSRLFRSPSSSCSSTQSVQKASWSLSPLSPLSSLSSLPQPVESSASSDRNGAAVLKPQTNGNFSAPSPAQKQASASPLVPGGSELDEDYDC